MPGFLDGEVSEQQDIERIAKHLTGTTLLSGSPRQRADLDRDGHIAAADLLNMARIVAGELPQDAHPPLIHHITPEISRPGSAITIHGDAIAPPGDEILVLIGGQQHPVDNVVNGQCQVTLPTGLSTGNINLRLVRNGLLSNTVVHTIHQGPILQAVFRAGPSVDADIVIEGQGFGTNPVTVHFSGTVIHQQSVNPASDTQLNLPEPAELANETMLDIAVEVAGVNSNVLPYFKRRQVSGQVALPAGSGLALQSLRLQDDLQADGPISAAGHFTATLLLGTPSTLQVVDSTDEIVLAAIIADDDAAPLPIDAQSTAVWLACMVANVRPQQIVSLLNQARAHPDILELGQVLASVHPATPQIREQFVLPGVAPAVSKARDALAQIVAQGGN